MAGWETHYAIDGAKGLVNDAPLAIGILMYRGTWVPGSSLYWRLHVLFHLPSTMAAVLFLGWLSNREIFFIIARHIALDYLTHKRGWLYYE